MTATLDAWLAGKAHNTARAYRPAVDAWLAWLGKDPARAIPRDAKAYSATLASRYRPATVAARLAACANFHGWLIEHGLARANPFEDVTRPHVPHNAASPVLSVAQLRRLQAHLAGPASVHGDDDAPLGRLRDRALVTFLLSTGRWPAEIAGLRWANLEEDGAGGHVLRWAGGVQALPAQTYDSLLTWHRAAGWPIEPDGFLWRRHLVAYNNLPTVGPLDPAGHITAAQITAIVRRIGRQVGIELCPGALRNTNAVLHSVLGGDVARTARTLGHAGPSTLGRLLDSPKGSAAMAEFGAALSALR